MTVLLYAVTEAGPPAVGYGLDQHPLRTLDHGGLRAVVSDHEGRPSGVESNLWTYEQVVEHLMSAGPVLPARFGTSAEDDEEITTMLAERQQELSESLDRVRGAVEIAIRAEPPPAPPPSGTEHSGSTGQSSTGQSSTGQRSTGSGTAYMLGRLEADRHVRELVDQVDAATQGLVRARTRRSANTLAYLVEHDHVDRFVREATALGLAPTGPWPPYSFVTPAAEA